MTIEYVSQCREDAYPKYKEVLAKPLTQNKFVETMIFFIDQYPFFLPPYVELLECFSCFGLRRLPHKDFMALTASRFDFFLSPNAMEDVIKGWSFEELWAYKIFLGRLKKYVRGNKTHVFWCKKSEMAVRSLILKTRLPEPKTCLKLVEHEVDTKKISGFLSKKEHFWYLHALKQKDTPYYNYKKTQTIILRNVVHDPKKPALANDTPENVRTEVAIYFSDVLSWIEDFVNKIHCGLGHVALVRLRPRNMDAWYLDSGANSQRGMRYHLVINGISGNLLMVGNDIAWAKEGDLWCYDSKTIHKFYNGSDEWRTYLFFDAVAVR